MTDVFAASVEGNPKSPRAANEMSWQEKVAKLQQLEQAVIADSDNASWALADFMGTIHKRIASYEYPNYTNDVTEALTLLPPKWLFTELSNGTLDPKFLQTKRFTRWHASAAPEHVKLDDVFQVRHWPTGWHEKAASAVCLVAIRAMLFNHIPHATDAVIVEHAPVPRDVRSDLSDLYWECHITIDPVFGALREKLEAYGRERGFRISKLILQKPDFKDSPEQFVDDAFFTARHSSFDAIHAAMIEVVHEVKAMGVNVRRYKIENTIIDSNKEDSLKLLTA